MSSAASPARYQIRVDGVLDPHWAAWFDNLDVDNDGRHTIISGSLADQAALHGLLAKIRDLGLSLISLQRLDETGPSKAGPA